ncbi:MAG: tetratricopeptide repeat protein [Acidobacteria bacterium]|nr:tetratricopeptide repeat protein [Acidobacteriota bacterium]
MLTQGSGSPVCARGGRAARILRSALAKQALVLLILTVVTPPASAQQALVDAQALEQRADLHMARKEYADAANLYRRLTQMEPENAVYLNKAGIAYHLLQDLDEAKKFYRRAAQANPKYGHAINNLASIEYAQKNYRSAILSYVKALEITPNDAVIYSNLGTAYFAYKKYDYAMQSYRYALLLDPNVFHDTGRVGTMVQQRNAENVAAFNFYLAKTYAEMGKTEESLLYLQKAWEEGFPNLLREMQDKVFAFLASETRFLELVSRIEASEQNKAN